MDDVVVWNVDARNRPELEVEIEVCAPEPEDVALDALFVDDDAPATFTLAARVIHSAPPLGYAQAYAAAG